MQTPKAGIVRGHSRAEGEGVEERGRRSSKQMIEKETRLDAWWAAEDVWEWRQGLQGIVEGLRSVA